jgi:hypothetical protein
MIKKTQRACWGMCLGLTLGSPISSCATGIGDSAARVIGQIVDESGKTYDSCRIELLHESGGRVLDYRAVKSTFLTTFVLPPKEEKYRLRLSCSGSAETVVSKALTLGNLAETYDKPVDLGTTILKRQH